MPLRLRLALPNLRPPLPPSQLSRLFPANVALFAAQSGLYIYVDAFILEGFHCLLDVTSSVEGSPPRLPLWTLITVIFR
ncbi:hypothetical protein GYH30_018719 [Glycine max]|nr:hypothetical protein GYH30_018719 [Glycine max]